jgi:hypothetical protein
VKLYLCLVNYTLYHEDIWKGGCIDRLFLASALDGGWARDSEFVGPLCYMLEGRGFRFQMSSSNVFNLPNPSGRTIALGFTQPVTEMSTRKCFW